jgi:cyclophilin family peptidyl-prolyl cis-trans isomerase
MSAAPVAALTPGWLSATLVQKTRGLFDCGGYAVGWKLLPGKRRSRTLHGTSRGGAGFVEPLENRTLCTATAARVVAINADNRGEVQIRVNKSLKASTVNKKYFRLYTAGPDKILNTGDDVQVSANVSYDSKTKTMTLRASVPADTNYRVKVYSSGIVDTDGLHLDGEYTGSYPSGNGVQGGNFEFRTKRDTSSTPLARITTSLGLIIAKLNKTAAPQTVANFVKYANSGRFDGSFIHRNSKSEAGSAIDVLQGGGFYTNFSPVPEYDPIPLEAGLPNLRGTLAMARQADTAGLNTATSSFFINVKDNPELNLANGFPGWSQNGYAVFATITSGLNVMDAIYALPTTSVGSGFFAPSNGGNFVVFSRVAIQMKVAAV